MKQLLQSARDGKIDIVDVPAPKLLPGCVLVRIAASLVSAGTERASSEFARKNILQKAQSRPDLVRDVFNKARRDGIFPTIAAVQSRLDQPSSLGYSSAGTVTAVAEDINDIHVGDRVACAGAGYAVHAEMACIPRMLVAKIPADADISFEEAAFTTIGAIAMHGIRTADAKLSDVAAVIGLGLLGQMTIQILKAAGCRVIGMDVVSQRAELALCSGADAVSADAEEFRDLCKQYSNGHGADAVLITAQTPSNDPVNLAAQIARDRGVVVAVGSVGMELDRKPYYEKEIDFRISRSYGPGRYDAAYEQKGQDYPIGYVRWTEARNMEAFLQLLADCKLDMQSLITHRFPIDRAVDAYELISNRSAEIFLGVLIQYPDSVNESPQLELVKTKVPAKQAKQIVFVGLLGAGSFAISTLLPAMERVEGINFASVCAANGAHALHAANKFGFGDCATDEAKIIEDPAVNTIAIATRHHLHARQVQAALCAGKHVFCEKPLCLTEEELSDIVRTYSYAKEKSLLMVGFNRRFSSMARQMKKFLEKIRAPLAMHYRVNAGFIPRDHWVNDPTQGGGRILGEVCHFVDFLIFLAGALPIEVQTRDVPDESKYSGDNVVITLQFANGSQGTISYLASGDRTFSKERVEVFGGGSVAVLEDFRRLELVRNGKRKVTHSWFRQDKGHVAEWQTFTDAIRNGSKAPIAFEDIIATTLTTFRALDSRSSGSSELIDIAGFLNTHSGSI